MFAFNLFENRVEGNNQSYFAPLTPPTHTVHVSGGSIYIAVCTSKYLSKAEGIPLCFNRLFDKAR